MKFIFAVVMLALAVSVQSSLVAQVAPGVSYVTSAAHGAGPWGGAWGGAWGGPWGGAWNGGWNGAWNGGWGGPAAVDTSAWGGHGGWAGGHGGWAGGHGWAGHPAIALSQGPAHGHEGVYVAKTRGAVHTAPLAGHVNSATSVNLAAAPGTH